MDYCSSCRRHLNGALVCPGCGAYAPDIAPSAIGGPTVSAAPAAVAPGTAAWEPPAADTWYDGYFRDETATPSTPSVDSDGTAPLAASEDVDVDVDGDGNVEGFGGAEGAPAAAPLGRAARRRQRARWKKNQRRAVVATAVALVGGGLTVSALDRQGGDKAQAATAPERPNAAAEQQETELTRPASTPADTREAPRAHTTPSKTSPTDAAREAITTPRATREFTRPDVAATPSPAATTAPQSQSVSSAAGGANSGTANSGGSESASGDSGGTSAEQQTPAPSATDSSDSGTATSPSSPAPEATSPAQLCVLNLVCLG